MMKKIFAQLAEIENLKSFSHKKAPDISEASTEKPSAEKSSTTSETEVPMPEENAGEAKITEDDIPF